MAAVPYTSPELRIAQDIAELRDRIERYEDDIAESDQRIAELRKDRDDMLAALAKWETALAKLKEIG